jgi:hypothetical protein
MKTYLTSLMALFFGLAAQATIRPHWDYDSLNNKATFVVIATPKKVKTTSERAALPYIKAGTNDVIGIGVESTFEVLTVLRGDRNVRTFLLHHFKLANSRETTLGGPRLVTFEPKDRKIYLLFLEQEADGRFAAVSGQTHPFSSVMEFTGQLPNSLHPDFDSAKAGHF